VSKKRRGSSKLCFFGEPSSRVHRNLALSSRLRQRPARPIRSFLYCDTSDLPVLELSSQSQSWLVSRRTQLFATGAQRSRRLAILVRGAVFSCSAVWHGFLRASWTSGFLWLLCSDYSLCRLSCIPTSKATTLTPLISATNSTKCVLRVLYLWRCS